MEVFILVGKEEQTKIQIGTGHTKQKSVTVTLRDTYDVKKKEKVTVYTNVKETTSQPHCL